MNDDDGDADARPAEVVIQCRAARASRVVDEITVRVDLGRGAAEATVWTCDFSYDYVKINADYRS